MVPRFCTLSRCLADSENLVPSGRMYPRRRPPSDRREPAERPDTDDTDDAVETERSSCGIAPSASDGVAHGSGDEAERESGGGGGELGVGSMTTGEGGHWGRREGLVGLRSVWMVLACCLLLLLLKRNCSKSSRPMLRSLMERGEDGEADARGRL